MITMAVIPIGLSLLSPGWKPKTYLCSICTGKPSLIDNVQMSITRPEPLPSQFLLNKAKKNRGEDWEEYAQWQSVLKNQECVTKYYSLAAVLVANNPP